MDPILQEQLTNIQKEIEYLKSNPTLPDHRHNGFDSSRILYDDISRKRVFVHHTIIGSMAATANNYGIFFISPFVCSLASFREVHQVAGSDGGAVTITLEALTATQAPGSGVEMLETTIDLKATANSVQSGVLARTVITNRNLEIGDRLCLKDAGTLTDVDTVSVIAELIMI